MPEPKKKYPRGKHPNSQKNLVKYPKGVSGNPAGCPPNRKNLAEAIYKVLNIKTKAKDPFDESGKIKFFSQEEMIIIKAIAQAREGDAKAREWIMDNAYGKLTENIDIKEESTQTLTWNINPIKPAHQVGNDDIEDAEVIE